MFSQLAPEPPRDGIHKSSLESVRFVKQSKDILNFLGTCKVLIHRDRLCNLTVEKMKASGWMGPGSFNTSASPCCLRHDLVNLFRQFAQKDKKRTYKKLPGAPAPIIRTPLTRLLSVENVKSLSRPLYIFGAVHRLRTDLRPCYCASSMIEGERR